MPWKRKVLEIGMGTDIRGADYTKAAVRALRDALWHNSLSVAKALGQDTDSMRVEVLIGVPQPDKVDKEAVLADNASWLYRTAPYMIFAATWVAAALVPTFATGLHFSWTADLIAITALLGSARFFLALVGMDVGTSFGGLGSSRERGR